MSLKEPLHYAKTYQNKAPAAANRPLGVVLIPEKEYLIFIDDFF